MATFTVQDYAKALREVTKDAKGPELKKILQSFAELLYKKNVLKKADSIISVYEKLVRKEEGIKEIFITTARAVDKSTLEQIKKVFGTKVEATTSVDETLLGGMIVKTEDTILDASLRTQLRALHEHLA